jgi:hypothetical protein
MQLVTLVCLVTRAAEQVTQPPLSTAAGQEATLWVLPLLLMLQALCRLAVNNQQLQQMRLRRHMVAQYQAAQEPATAAAS